MNDKICPICKYYGRITWGNHRDIIYQDRQEIGINLCYHHSVDFFKNGQTNFMYKYREVFSGYDLMSYPQQTFSSKKVASLFGF